jgi:hypothetical protein
LTNPRVSESESHATAAAMADAQAIADMIQAIIAAANAAGAAAAQNAVPPAPPAPQSRPIKVVRSAEVGGKTYLESEADVDDYLGRLKAELLAVIQSGQRARIQ